ncbi:hypothetical protein ACKI1K_43840, partial [Streptomyces scabiei]|uniref:hypothetical protein n=1 Tax=Streptomyces scabiei TaxID=1930 RepID=UPI0038F621B8
YKLVLWPREPMQKDGETVYRYVVIGMICTNEPIDFPNESVAIGGTNFGAPLTEIIKGMEKTIPDYPLATADSALLSVVEMGRED